MSTYSQIFGGKVNVVASDPSNPINGQVWYNSTTKVLKFREASVAGAWAAGGNVGTARNAFSGAGTQTAALAAGGITTASQLSFGPAGTTQADSLTAVSITTVANSSTTSGAKAGAAVYTVFMPASGGTVTITATGGSSLSLAAQVAVTASATVTDSGAAALAAVTALATQVASLRTLITTLTNLVLKIQKKVRA
jgi:hypothetical protein